MPTHDWTRVEAGIFHAFHASWITEIQKSLNSGLLPAGYYALGEQHAGRTVADVLTLHASEPPREPFTLPMPPAPDTGGIALAEAPPRTRHKRTMEPDAWARRRSLAIRHVSGHRLVALIEIVSPGNKDRIGHIEQFTDKVLAALNIGVHVLLIDLFAPGRFDPDGLHGILLREVEQSEERYDLPAGEPVTLASYVGGPGLECYVDHAAIGAPLPEMPLFLRPDRYVNVPLEPTYQAAYGGLPSFWRDVLESAGPATS